MQSPQIGKRYQWLSRQHTWFSEKELLVFDTEEKTLVSRVAALEQFLQNIKDSR